jgi:hypothetical protein
VSAPFGSPSFDPRGTLGNLPDQFIVHVLLHDEPGSGHAGLPRA